MVPGKDKLMGAKWAAMQMPKGAKIDGNDDRHNLTDSNGGGSPALGSRQRIPDAHRGGPYQSGQRQYATASIPGTRGSAGNPASRGNLTPVGRQSTPSEARVPGHGGSPQHRGGAGTGTGFGDSGQMGVPGVRSNPQPGAGNVSGKMATRIAGRFNNKSKGAKATGTIGSYGDRAPINANT